LVLGREHRADAEDIVHDAAVELLCRPVFPDDEDQLQRFLKAIIRNRALEIRRHQRVTDRLASKVRNPESMQAPDEACAVREVSGRVREELLRLPGRTREVLELYRLLDQPAREVAKRLGIREATVRELDQRGKRRLRAALSDLREQS
jgi:RNA polymerase sigma factor (sigma-70 family)